jgi:hypothetical protein
MIGAENRRHILLLCLSLLLSGGGIIGCAYYWHSPADAGRGGALAVAISFFALFANSPHGSRLFLLLTREKENFRRRLSEMREEQPNSPPDIAILTQRLEALLIRVEADVAGQEKQNIFIAWSACIGTLAWGFGDWIAMWLLAMT